MGGAETQRAAYYRPAEVARLLRCSEWWVKEQARRRRIPYSWIGGSYRFTDDHIAEIIRLFEVRPNSQAIDPAEAAATLRPRPQRPCEPATRLRARPPG